jgi:hypothetical protein
MDPTDRTKGQQEEPYDVRLSLDCRPAWTEAPEQVRQEFTRTAIPTLMEEPLPGPHHRVRVVANPNPTRGRPTYTVFLDTSGALVTYAIDPTHTNVIRSLPRCTGHRNQAGAGTPRGRGNLPSG